MTVAVAVALTMTEAETATVTAAAAVEVAVEAVMTTAAARAVGMKTAFRVIRRGLVEAPVYPGAMATATTVAVGSSLPPKAVTHKRFPLVLPNNVAGERPSTRHQQTLAAGC